MLQEEREFQGEGQGDHGGALGKCQPAQVQGDQTPSHPQISQHLEKHAMSFSTKAVLSVTFQILTKQNFGFQTIFSGY